MKTQNDILSGALRSNAARCYSERRLAPSPFVAALRVAILKTVRDQRSDGCSGMSVDCLCQCVAAPSYLLDGAPRGASSRWLYGELFRAEASRLVPDFILSEREVRA